MSNCSLDSLLSLAPIHNACRGKDEAGLCVVACRWGARGLVAPIDIDRKGITERVSLSGMTLMNRLVHLLPLRDEWVVPLPAGAADARPGVGRARRSSWTRRAEA
jgi:hypothetical protein